MSSSLSAPQEERYVHLTSPVAMLEAQVCVGACTLELRVQCFDSGTFLLPTDKKPRRPNDVSVPHFIAAASSKLAAETQLDQPIVRKYPEKPPRGPAAIAAGSNLPVQRKDSQHSHASSHALSSPGSHSHSHGHAHCSCENDSQQSAGSASNESHSTHTSGYQTDDGTFEGKVLHRASRDRPANLRMTAIRDYNPCCKEELAVRKGQRVKVLYKNNDWVYALTKSGEAGYIPFHFVRPSRKYAGYQSEPEFCNDHDVHMSGYDTDMPTIHDRRRGYGGRGYGGHGHRTQVGDVVPSYSVHGGFQGSPEELGSRMDTARHLSGYTSAVEYPGSSLNMHPRRYPRSARSLHCILDASLVREYSRPTERKPEYNSFQRQFIEELVVIHDFEAKEEDEVFVGKGERVRVLNAEDPFWLWVETMPGDEGYIPRACCSLGDHPCKLCRLSNMS